MDKFQCGCGGKIKIVSETEVLHACKQKYAHGTSYYDGIDRFMPYKRVQINPNLTNGEIKYNWFFKWDK